MHLGGCPEPEQRLPTGPCTLTAPSLLRGIGRKQTAHIFRLMNNGSPEDSEQISCKQLELGTSELHQLLFNKPAGSGLLSDMFN